MVTRLLAIRSSVRKSGGLVAVAIVVTGILAYQFLVPRGQPEDNPHPQQRRVISGLFPYDQGWELRIETSYYTRNPACRRTAKAFGIFPQAEVTRTAWRYLPVTREAGNRYRFEFFDDAVLPGDCDWQLKFINYVIAKDGKEIQGGAIMGLGTFNVIRYRCKEVRIRTLSGIACGVGTERLNEPGISGQQIDFLFERTD